MDGLIIYFHLQKPHLIWRFVTNQQWLVDAVLFSEFL